MGEQIVREVGMDILQCLKWIISVCFDSTYTKIGMIQKRLAWPLRKDNTQIREAFHIFKVYKQ